MNYGFFWWLLLDLYKTQTNQAKCVTKWRRKIDASRPAIWQLECVDSTHARRRPPSGADVGDTQTRLLSLWATEPSLRAETQSMFLWSWNGKTAQASSQLLPP